MDLSSIARKLLVRIKHLWQQNRTYDKQGSAAGFEPVQGSGNISCLKTAGDTLSADQKSNPAECITVPARGEILTEDFFSSDVNVLRRTFADGSECGNGKHDRKRVLFMDDELLITMTAGQMLAGCGYDVALAGNGAEAVDIYNEAMKSGNPFSLLILDLTVPWGMGGIETFRAILEINPSAQAIVTSGYLNDPVMSDYKEYGFAGALPKPFTGEDLLEAVSRSIR